MLSFLRNLFRDSLNNQSEIAGFKFVVCNNKSEAPNASWFRLRKWRSPNFLIINTSYSKDWKIFKSGSSLNGELGVAGTHIDNRKDAFLLLGNRPDFKIYLEREIDNSIDPNAIKVMGVATVNGEKTNKHIGYIPKDVAGLLKDEEEIDARPYSVYLPHRGRTFGLNVRVLVRSNRFKKRQNQ